MFPWFGYNQDQQRPPPTSDDPANDHDGLATDQGGHDDDHSKDDNITHYDTVLRQAQNVAQSLPDAHILASPTSVSLENLVDPYTGEVKGTLHASSGEPDTSNITDSADTPDNSASLWSHLSKIRELQGEISQLHVQMEGVSAQGKYNRRRNRSNADLAGLGLNDETDVGGEFRRLAGRFKGREAEIDKIMNKLDELSHCVTEFHQLQMPSFHSQSSPPEKTDKPQSPSTTSSQSPTNPLLVPHEHINEMTSGPRAMPTPLLPVTPEDPSKISFTDSPINLKSDSLA